MFDRKMFTRSFQFAIIVSLRAPSRLRLFCSAFIAQRGRLIGMETGQELWSDEKITETKIGRVNHMQSRPRSVGKLLGVCSDCPREAGNWKAERKTHFKCLSPNGI